VLRIGGGDVVIDDAVDRENKLAGLLVLRRTGRVSGWPGKRYSSLLIAEAAYQKAYERKRHLTTDAVKTTVSIQIPPRHPNGMHLKPFSPGPNVDQLVWFCPLI
jgi:hypothetical protein